MSAPRRRRLARRRFELSDQQRFADATGDRNPVHLDPLVARRTMVGQPVVHGVHLLLWAIDAWAEETSHRGGRPAPPTHIAATFAKPAFLDETLACTVTERGAAIRLELSAGTTVLTTIDLTVEETAPPSGPVPAPPAPHGTPVERSLTDLDGLHGTMPIEGDVSMLEAMAPFAVQQLGSPFVATIGALSRLVGMECPGLHSLFSSLVVDVEPTQHLTGAITWSVTRADERVGAVDLSVDAGAVRGALRAFVRPAPTRQPDWDDAAALVAPGEFAGQRALIVGGSRGLGEVTARLVAAGGGYPAVTYVTGEADAEAVAQDLRDHGASCETVRLDVRVPRTGIRELARRGWTPTHVYYYATPRIFVRKSELFEPSLFRQFSAIYVDGFVETWRACRAATDDELRVLYPSSVALEDRVRALTEYATAKAAGEESARQIDRFDTRSAVEVVRFPRIVTDQTATLMPAPAADAATAVLEAMRALDARTFTRPSRSAS